MLFEDKPKRDRCMAHTTGLRWSTEGISFSWTKTENCSVFHSMKKRELGSTS